ncbi:hypothetical protein HDU83_003092 [Entophlyctis luteolus]|nr:hypothetical protein HDU82_002642 [Entophlyctis luteolus]KAJ3346440.1 hypothetical protein HDU83_003092 [Entophlyctis luteolus]KAJ3385271.1 hypothetical protein HDU84_002375 [Entophlyctis sp. JEL0112]
MIPQLLFPLFAVAAHALQYLGVDEAGLEFGISPSGVTGTVPGTLGTDYFAPSATAMTNAASKFSNLFRISFAWERVQPTLNGDLNAAYLATIDSAVQTATGLGAVAVLDLHNYAKYQGSEIGAGTVTAANLADVWTKLAQKYMGNNLVWFGLMNEPTGIDANTWFAAAQVAITAIRNTGATNVISVPGNCFTGAHSWVSGNCDVTATSNAVAALTITDPGNNMVFEMHQYFDSDFSGTHAGCVNDFNQLTAATAWLRSNGKKGFLGEFAGDSSSQCQTVVQGVLNYLNQNSDVWTAASWWAAGSAWGTYMYSIEDNGSTAAPDAAELAILAQFKVGSTAAATSAAAVTTVATTAVRTSATTAAATTAAVSTAAAVATTAAVVATTTTALAAAAVGNTASSTVTFTMTVGPTLSVVVVTAGVAQAAGAAAVAIQTTAATAAATTAAVAGAGTVTSIVAVNANPNNANCGGTNNQNLLLYMGTSVSISTSGLTNTACGTFPMAECGLPTLQGSVVFAANNSAVNILSWTGGNQVFSANTFQLTEEDDMPYYGGTLVLDLPCSYSPSTFNSALANQLAFNFVSLEATVDTTDKNGNLVTANVAVTTK